MTNRKKDPAVTQRLRAAELAGRSGWLRAPDRRRGPVMDGFAESVLLVDVPRGLDPERVRRAYASGWNAEAHGKRLLPPS